MRTIILDGSPKNNIKESNTLIFINEFMRNINEKYPIKFISKEDPENLVQTISEYDTVLLFMPLYVHAMPGSVMKFIEKLNRETMSGKNIGFIVQAGFTESSQHRFVEPYFKQLAKDLNCNYLGTVSKGESAAIYMFPDKFKKVFPPLNKLGEIFHETNSFDKDICKELSYPYNISDLPFHTKLLLKILEKTNLSNFFWHMMMKRNNAYEHRIDKPFL